MPSCFPVVSSCDVASGKLPISLSLLEVYERQVPVYILVITILAYAFSVASSKWFPAPCRFCHVTLIIIQASFSIRFLKFRQKLCLQSISSTTSSYRASAMPPFTPCFGFSLPLLITCFLTCPWIELVTASAAPLYNHRSCEAAVQEWSNKEKLALNKELKLVQPGSRKILELLFFLHIPRTGGRTYHQWQPSCKLLSSHDDMSILSKIPSRASVVTNLRNPVNRVLSTYEFSVEVAARFLRLKSINSSRSPLPLAKSPSQLVSTLTIWPWKYLVPFMQHDIFTRRDARLEGKVNWPQSTNTTYDAPTITMPLTEFIHHPVAHELVHNGATFQVAGLTNNSCNEDAVMVRKCSSLYPKLGHQVLDVAKRRLDYMLFVGLTEKHQESATIFFSLVADQAQVQSKAMQEILGQNASVPGEGSTITSIRSV